MKILLLVHSDLIPPEEVDEAKYDWAKIPWATEYEVKKTLLASGHKVLVLGVIEDLLKIRKAIEDFKPSIVFNLLEEFKGEALFDQHIVSYLELLGIPYTGCNPKGMTLGRDKALSKKILAYHKIKTPAFEVFPKNKVNKKIQRLKDYPAIVKCLNEEASLGLSQASVVKNKDKLLDRVRFIHKNFNTDAIAEHFIMGTEYFVGVYGNYRLKTLPPFQLSFSDEMNPEKQFYSTNAKFDTGYRERNKISTAKAEIPEELSQKLQKISKRAYKALGLSGYARMDLRVDNEGSIYVIEANPNPDISEFDDFANSAKTLEIDYPSLLKKIISLGKDWSPTD